MSHPKLLLGMLVIVLVSACSTTQSTPGLDVSQPIVLNSTSTFQVDQPLAEPGVTVTPAEQVLPAATSRGPDLEATDPASVSLASGGLQLLEFFRFT